MSSYTRTTFIPVTEDLPQSPLVGPWVQESENDRPHTVFVHGPQLTSTEVFIGALHPSGALFEKGINQIESCEHHLNLVTSLEKAGVAVHRVRDVLANIPHKELLNFAMDFLTYSFDGGDGTLKFFESLTEHERFLLSDAYKKQSLERMSAVSLVNIILTQPTVILAKSSINTPLTTVRTAFNPCFNLLFTRDQQIVTAKGLVICHMGSPQRLPETKIMRRVFRSLNIPIVAEVSCPNGQLEGGDFIPVSKDLCLVGTGLRSTEEACAQLMAEDAFGTTRVGVVVDKFDMNQDRMHLDTVFNIASPTLCVMLKTIIGKDSPIHRVVKEYVRGDNDRYTLNREVEFSEFIESEGYTIAPIAHEEQLKYMCNFVNLGDNVDPQPNAPGGGPGKGHLLAVHQGLEERLREYGYTGRVEYVEFQGVKNMYGAAHCATQIFRKPMTSSVAF
eukprot:TRINITY_DN5402_c0_g1_i2.p1 TRINITY_DN5402_c0_g1~~TRINITY_DN5402_c0_g1_i2.p1  ORF type:complete len:446 (+),score=127.72 TRINITY_DN5402_c0_g1_i2:63-1400(+)